MSKYITVHVEDFVQIRQADIELAPLTLLVGDNNSGKSYLASLLWGILDDETSYKFIYDAVFNNDVEKLFQELCNWLRKFLECGDNPVKYFKITQDMHQSILTLFNKALDNKKKEFVRSIFGADIPIGQITFDFPFDENLSFAAEIRTPVRFWNDNNTNIPQQEVSFSVSKNIKGVQSISSKITQEKSKISNNINDWLLNLFQAYYLKYLYGEVTFFPASRTGFLLTYRSLINESLERRFNNFREKNGNDYYLTSPQVSFLRKIANPRVRNATVNNWLFDIESLINFIENKMICGKISLSDSPTPDILYCPNGGDNIPMYLSSGVVTEIAPLLACLKYDRLGDYCIIEEPETSLHPELQWRMTQVLIRIANSKVNPRFVVISTHSDMIIQHINNMIKLSCQPDCNKLAKENDYETIDIISADKVRMYQFDVNSKDQSTNVTTLKNNKNGFIVPTFGKTLRKLRNDVYNFQHEIEYTETKDN
jgi:energy-coupling factor transporter ATP-binding protein EcfA2